MEIMWSGKKVKSYLFATGLQWPDFFLILLLVPLAVMAYKFRMPITEAFQGNTQIVLGYSAKQGEDGLFYVLDNSHERLLCFDESGKVQFSLEEPADEKSDLLYMDDFFVTPDGIYIAATEWDEMAIAREVVLFYNKQGEYADTLLECDYSENSTNKHRFYGISEKDGELQYVKCLSDSILIGDLELPYENAFHAVSDAVFVGDIVYILDKNGTIRAFDGSDSTGVLVYDAAMETDENVVPYRLAAGQDGNVYFTDIRNEQIRLVDMQEKNSSVVYFGTDSLTVNLTEENELLLVEERGLLVTGDGKTDTYLELEKNGKTIFFQIVWLIALLLLCILSLLLIIRLGCQIFRKKYTMPQMISMWVIGAVGGVSILLCSMLMNAFSNSYREKIEEQVISAAYMVANQIAGDDIQKIEETGGFGGEAYSHLCQVMESSFPMDIDFYKQLYCNILKLSEDGQEGYAVAYLDQSIGSYFPLDEVESEELKEVYMTGEAVWNQEVNDISGTYLSVKVPVYDETGSVCGAVAVGVETYVITDTLRTMITELLVSIIIVLLLVWLISVEGMSFANNRDLYKKNILAGETNVLPGHLIRLLVFLVFVAYNMTATFLPVYLMRKTDCFPKAMREVAGALPITVNIFIIGVMSLFCANLVGKFGIRKIMAASALCSFAGNLCIFLFPNFYAICAGLVLDGIGVGLITNAIYVMLTYIKDEVNRTWGLTIYNGASLSGINFGMMLGSMLAVTIGQHMVFGIVAVTWIVMVLLTGYLVKQMEGMLKNAEPEKTDRPKRDRGISGWHFAFSKSVLSFIVLIQNTYIIFGSFVFYYVPLYCSENGYDETVCSVLIMLYSQVAVLGGSRLTEWFSKHLGKYAMYLALAANITALLIFAAFNSMAGMVAALLLMGMSAAFGKPVQQAYYLGLEKVKQYGEDKSIGIYNFTENIGESLGPVVFGRMMATAKFSAAIQLFCSIITGAGAVHYFISRKEFKNADKKRKI